MKTNMPNGVTDKELKEMQSVDIMTVDINSLADINDVVLNPDLPKEERAKEFIRQIKNPLIDFFESLHYIKVEL